MSGPELMREVARAHPELTIEERLDAVRTEMLGRHVTHLKTIRTDSALELLEVAVAWDLAHEDLERLLKIMTSEFPPEIANEAQRLLEGDLGWSIYIFMQKHYQPRAPGCFSNWPWCSRSSSTSGTGRRQRASCS